MSRGVRIKELMEKYNIDVKELADYISKSDQYIYQILKDKIDNPSVKALNLIAKKFGVTLDYLENGTTDRIAYQEPEICNRLPRDLQEFVAKEENTAFITFAKQLSRYDIDELLRNIDDADMKFLLTGLKIYIEQHKSNKSLND